MRRLALYESPPPLATAGEEPLDANARCARCALSGCHEPGPIATKEEIESIASIKPKVRTVCMRPEGESGGLLVVGEGPGREEDAAGRPWIGPSGRIVREAIERYWKGPVALENATRCAKGAAEMKPEFVEACRAYVARTIEEVQPRRIIALGAWASYSLLGRSIAPLSTRKGYAYYQPASGEPVPVFSVLHPAAALRNRFVRAMFDEDLVFALTASPPLPPWGAQVHVLEDARDVLLALDDLRDAPWVSFDVETAGHMYDPSFRILCMATCAAFDRNPYVFTREACADPVAQEALRAWFVDERAKKVGANVKYDMTSENIELGAMPRGVIGDVRLWRKLLDPEAEAKLDRMVELVGMGGMKEEQKEAMAVAVKRVKDALRDEKRKTKLEVEIAQCADDKKRSKLVKRRDAIVIPTLRSLGVDEHLEPIVRDPENENEKWSYAVVPKETLWRYCARDAVGTTALAELLEPQLTAVPQLRRVWDLIASGASEAIAQVEAWGIPCSLDAVRAFDAVLGIRELSLAQQLDGYFSGVNWQSAPQIREVLFRKLGLPVVKLTDTSLESTDKDTLEQLRGAHPLVDVLLDYRKVMKLRGTYALGMLRHVRSDGRVHPSILLDGARSGRTSSQNPNMQNVPRPGTPESKMARDCFAASPGHTLVELDFSQIELRVAAMLSGDPVMVQVFKDGIDFHQKVAETVSRMMWGVAPDAVTGEMRAQVKPLVFGKLYGKGDKAVAKDLKLYIDRTTRKAKTSGSEDELDVRKAKEVIASIFGRFKRLDQWTQECLAETRRTGYTHTWWAGERARRRMLWRIADQDDEARSVAEHGSYNCLDPETEALTRRGWVRGFELRMGDVLLTKNQSTGALEWQAMTDLKLFDDYKGKLVEFRSKSFSAISTPNHRWLVRDRHSGKDVERTTATLSRHGDHRIHRTGEYVGPGTAIYLSDFVMLAGWYLTDGTSNYEWRAPRTYRGRTYKPRRGAITICQSARANPHKVAQIDLMFERLGVRPSRSEGRNEIVQWRVVGDLAEKLQRLFPGRLLSWEFLWALTPVQARVLFNTMMLGDGWVSGHRRFCTRSRESAERFQALVTLCGEHASVSSRDMSKYRPRSSKLKNIPRMGTIWIVSILQKKYVQVVKSQVREVEVERARVWCPVVPNTFFVARREGKVFVTGNTQCQGSASDFLLASLVECVRWIQRENVPAKLCVPVHDSMLFEVRDDAVDLVVRECKRLMEQWPTAHGVPLVADAKVGAAWGSMDKWKPSAQGGGA